MSSASSGWSAVYSPRLGPLARVGSARGTPRPAGRGARASGRSSGRSRRNSLLPPGIALSWLLEPTERADVPLAGGRLLEAQGQRRLGVRQLLEVAEDQHLAVERVEGVERLLELGPSAPGGRPPRWRWSGGRGAARPGLPTAPPASDPWSIGTSRAASRAWQPRCLRWSGDEPHAGEPAEPEEEGHLGPSRVLGQPRGGVEVDLLDHVGRVEAAEEAAVEPDGDHSPETRPVLVEQPVPGVPVASGGPTHAFVHRVRVVGRRAHNSNIARAGLHGTGLFRMTRKASELAGRIPGGRGVRPRPQPTESRFTFFRLPVPGAGRRAIYMIDGYGARGSKEPGAASPAGCPWPRLDSPSNG